MIDNMLIILDRGHYSLCWEGWAVKWFGKEGYNFIMKGIWNRANLCTCSISNFVLQSHG
mgnify:CR=1